MNSKNKIREFVLLEKSTPTKVRDKSYFKLRVLWVFFFFFFFLVNL